MTVRLGLVQNHVWKNIDAPFVGFPGAHIAGIRTHIKVEPLVAQIPADTVWIQTVCFPLYLADL